MKRISFKRSGPGLAVALTGMTFPALAHAIGTVSADTARRMCVQQMKCIDGGLCEVLCNVAGHMMPGINLLNLLLYIAGIVLGMSGVFKLKQHADMPQQVPIKDGFLRLIAGAGIMSLPFILNTLIQSVFGAS
ncbi:MAG: hypothetical protein U9N14_06635 [Pseudomonadota bacterium]|nr:hypothetical protein [Pseudomonadota bacterium]